MCALISLDSFIVVVFRSFHGYLSCIFLKVRFDAADLEIWMDICMILFLTFVLFLAHNRKENSEIK